MGDLHIAPDLIVSDPEIMSGAPCFAGTHVPVDFLFGNLVEGMPLDTFLEAYPSVTRDAAIQALQAAAKYLQFHAKRIKESADSDIEHVTCMTCDGRRRILSGPDMLDASKAADLLGFSAVEVAKRAQDRELLALPHPDNRHRLYYPEWQFTPEVLEHLPGILHLFYGWTPWQCYRFFKHNNQLLNDETPIEALIAGDLKAVMTVVRIAAQYEQ